LTYARAGVDIDAKSKAIATLVKELTFQRKGIGAPVDIGGHFTGLVDFGDNYLSLCTDSVGTKSMVAEALDKWDTIGIDCIAMNANDMICVGAEPLAFVDYIAVGKPRPKIVAAVGRGLSKGAELANLSIIGGETAVVPEMVHGLDLAGTCLGFVKKGEQITGSGIRVGDDVSVGEELLTPTHMYVRPILDLIRKVEVHGLANITGGGLRNLLRLKPDVQVRITDPLPVPPIFPSMQRLGKIAHREMYQIFNMGMGFALVLPPVFAETATEILSGHGLHSKVVGRIAKGSGATLTKHKLKYDKY
jgi:phosphoribosylformylglycinamidine cyclo-ligase